MRNREVYDELKADFQKKKKSKKIDKYKIFLLILLFVFCIPFLALIFMKKYERIDSFDNISEPIQIPASGGTSIMVNGDMVRIDFLAEYDLQGRVLAVAQYGGNIFERIFHSYYLEDNIIRYRDVGIGWGYMGQDDYANRFNRRSSSRGLHPGFKTREDWNYMFDRFTWEDINSHMSHNHLIPANDRIKKLLRGIQKGQFVHIKGYLVRLHSDRGYQLVSSLTREDMGDGACETIYVTDITRLKEK